jgi:hypothetical protein
VLNEVLDEVTVLVEIDAPSDMIVVLVIEFVVDCCIFDDVLITLKCDVADVTCVSELVILVYDDVCEPSVVLSATKIKKKLTVNIVGSYHIHKD